MRLLIRFGRRTEGVQGASGKPPASINVRQLGHQNSFARACRADYGADGRAAALRGAVLSFEAKESTKESQRHGDSRGGPPRCALFANIGVPGTAVPGSCICSGLPVANCLRQLCPLGTRSLSAQASACGSRTVGRPEFIRVVQFRPKGRNSLTTFRGQTALRGCPRARGVRCRIAPYRSLCSPPTLPAGRFGLRPRPHWGHASLRDSSLRSPAGKKPFIAHF